ncbi:MAG: hypothetical protein AAF927_13820 [Bacteroidota bacterium]
MEEAIFTYEGIVNYCQTHFSLASKPSIFEPTELEKRRIDAFRQRIKQSTTPQFGFVVDLVSIGNGPAISQAIEHQALFDNPHQLSFQHFVDSIHPDYRQAYIWFGQASYMTLQLPAIREMLSEGLELRYVFTLPICRDIGKAEGKRTYEWWQQTAEILRLSPNKTLLAHLNRYTFLNSYQSVITQNGAIFSDIINTDGDTETASLFAILKSFMLPAILEVLPANEAKMLMANLEGKHTIKEISKSTGYSLDTVRTYQSRLLKRINPPFPLFPDRAFTTVKDAIILLQKIIS